jgi:hemerythrin-like metal-binding protein
MAFIVWNDDLAVGLPKLDQEHRELVALVGDLFNTADSPRDVGLFEWRMDLLIKHTLAHFAFEERLMHETNYRYRQPHQLQHRALIMQIRILRTAVIEDLLDWDDEMIRLIRDWLLVHIIEADRPLAAYLRNLPAAPFAPSV